MEMVLTAGANKEFFSCFLGNISDLNFPEKSQQKVALGGVVGTISSKFSLVLAISNIIWQQQLNVSNILWHSS
jgi:predicted tellurium resistance membrane protein TerC